MTVYGQTNTLAEQPEITTKLSVGQPTSPCIFLIWTLVRIVLPWILKVLALSVFKCISI